MATTSAIFPVSARTGSPHLVKHNSSKQSPHCRPIFSSSLPTQLTRVFTESLSSSRRLLLETGIGLLAPLLAVDGAGATRIEYYATVGEPLCDLNFVRSGLGYCDISVGTGVEAPQGELINIHYTARFEDGIVFDSSYKRARPLTMRIGVGKVIPGLDQGISGGDGVPPMHVGGKRKLYIPPRLAYGPEPAGCFSVLRLGLPPEVAWEIDPCSNMLLQGFKSPFSSPK